MSNHKEASHQTQHQVIENDGHYLFLLCPNNVITISIWMMSVIHKYFQTIINIIYTTNKFVFYSLQMLIFTKNVVDHNIYN